MFGGASIGTIVGSFKDPEAVDELYKTLKEGGCDTIDTARIYADSEEFIGKTHGGDLFTLDSKTPGGFEAGTSTSTGIVQHAKEAVEKLGVKSVSGRSMC